MPRQPLDVGKDLAKERSSQVTFGELQGEVPGVADQPPAGLEELLLQARERPVLDGDGQRQPLPR